MSVTHETQVVSPVPVPVVQRSLRVGPVDDPAEAEADVVADRVMRMPSPAGVVQRCPGGCPGDEELRRQPMEDEDEGKLPDGDMVQAKGASGGVLDAGAVSRIGGTRGRGAPLAGSVRGFFEPRFGADFSGVRVHADASAAKLAAGVNARAFTVGRDVFFAAGEFRPGTSSGDRLIAHELTHTLQQNHKAARIRRFVSCTPARMLGGDCPGREPREIIESRREPMFVEYILSPAEGYLVAGFGVGQSTVRSSALKHPNWKHLVTATADSSTHWRLLGFSDCHGDDVLNAALRQDRAKAILASLPSSSKHQVGSVGSAKSHDCITGNTTKQDRMLNRSVLIAQVSRDVVFPQDIIKGTRSIPALKTQPTVDCSVTKRREIAQAHPIAVAMVGRALDVLRRRKTPEIELLLKKYFNDASASTYLHVIPGFKKIASGLASDVKIQCENIGSPQYHKRCSSSKTTTTIGYVYSVFGFRVHVCEAGFGRSDLALAHTLVHEFSHMFDFTDDKEYCPSGCSSSLSRWSAYDNADSYAGFAKEAYLKF